MSNSFRHSHYVVPTSLQQGAPLAEVLAEVTNSLRGFSAMLGHTLASPESPWAQEEMCGVTNLLDNQVDILFGLVHRVRETVEELDASKAGEKQLLQDGDLSERAKQLRREFLLSSTNAGNEPAVIAAAMNMKRSAIERMIGQLRGEAARVAAVG
ncbi:hypothetical protein [Methylobacterium sp. Leaf85]|uniref:hypothetical protein n=1 Tax=Methylobacterium sp. Leaf85 TaxID=1736241 RepID=UPI0006FAD41F|nr:hypothetical protein [Methylobacterium sp. Leaf85]KQO53057.1 hypothetical protein ASF08_19220 [Methylobacterium sp. Leaf85]